MTNYFSTQTFESKIAPGVSYKLRKISHGRRTRIQIKAAASISKISELQRKLVPISEEIERAENVAKIEPCTCTHTLDAADPMIADRIKDLEIYNPILIADGRKPAEIKDICHSAVNGRCIVTGCDCRKPKPDPTIGGYEAQQEVIDQIVSVQYQELLPVYVKELVSEVQGLMIDDKPATVESLLEDGSDHLTAELDREIQRLIKMTPDESLGFKSPTTSGAAVGGPVMTTDQQTVPPVSPESTTSSATAADSSPS